MPRAALLSITLNARESASALPLPWNLVTLGALVLAPIALAAPFFWRYGRAAFIEYRSTRI